MNWLRNSVSFLGATLLCGLAIPGCEDNESMLFVMGVLSIETTNCVAKPERGATVRAAGTLDVALNSGGYRAALLVGSQLTPRGSREQLRTETARLSLEGAEITLTDSSGNLLPIGYPNPFSTVGTGFVDPAAGTDPGLAAIFVDMIPAPITAAVAGSFPKGDGVVVARVRVYGTTLGGQEIESGEYAFPIHVCSGCLVSYPQSSIVPGANGDPECTGAAVSNSSTVCVRGQDQVTNCTTCAGALAVCRLPCENCAVRSDDANDSLCANDATPDTCLP